ncbi:MAG: tetratricopeptide repeat protein [Lentimicrobium sp.]|nr:tetratricopeptide repeat protein [Lentimicrobium sp.]
MKKSGSIFGFAVFTILWIMPVCDKLTAGPADSLKVLAAAASADTTAIRLLAETGDYFARLDQHDSALYYYNRALSLVGPENESQVAPVIYYKLNRLFYKSGNYDISLEYLFKVLLHYDIIRSSAHDTAKIEIQTALAYGDIGLSYFSMENYLKSKEYFEKGYAIIHKLSQSNQKKDATENMFVFIINLGSVHVALEEFGKAREYFEVALGLNKQLGKIAYDAVLYNNLGIIFKEEKNYQKAYEYYLKCADIRETISDTAGLAQVNNNLGNLEFMRGNYKIAIDFLQKALNFSRKSKNLKSEMLSADFLSRTYEKTREFDKALEMHKLFKQLHDSILDSEKLHQTARLELQYQYEKLRKETELQQEIELAKKERKSLIYLIIAGIFLFTVVILYLINRNQRIKMKQVKLVKESLELEQKNLTLEKQNLLLEKQNLELELEYRNKELATHVMYLVNKNEFLASITEKLLAIRHMLLPENKTVVQEIIREMKSNIDNTVWNEFEVRFQNVHQDFYQKLGEKYPDLTPNEIKLCAFLRLNMTTKDISSITFQSLKSIQVARARLRKKLGITRDENLVSLLQQLG